MSVRRAVRVLLVNLNQKHRLNYIFIHINKTGGSSIEKALKLPLEHKTAVEVIDIIGADKWRSKFSFAFVRNPWDKVVSHYLYRVATNQTGLASKGIPFNDWVRLAYWEKEPEYYDKPKMFMPQYDWISDETGKIVVDFVGRFERINEDFDKICRKLNKNVALPHMKSMKRKHYREYYSDESIEIVRDYFFKDIEEFNYSFDNDQ